MAYLPGYLTKTGRVRCRRLVNNCACGEHHFSGHDVETMVCPECGRERPYCSKAALLRTIKKCSKCGVDMVYRGGIWTCPNCGIGFEGAPPRCRSHGGASGRPREIYIGALTEEEQELFEDLITERVQDVNDEVQLFRILILRMLKDPDAHFKTLVKAFEVLFKGVQQVHSMGAKDHGLELYQKHLDDVQGIQLRTMLAFAGKIIDSLLEKQSGAQVVREVYDVLPPAVKSELRIPAGFEDRGSTSREGE